MNQTLYLVSIDTSLDNIIRYVTSNLDEARAVAESAKAEVPPNLLEVYGGDEAEVQCISIVTVQNGVPISREVIRNFDDE